MMTTIRTPDTTTPAASTPRLTKHDRVALEAIQIAAALPGKWTVGRGRDSGEVADLLCLSTGFSIGLAVWQQRAWGYHLIPGEVPRELLDVWVWQERGEEDPFSGFAVGTPAAEVASYIHQHLIPTFHKLLTRARTIKRERIDARERQRVVREQVATQLQARFPGETGRDRKWPERVSVYYLGFDDLMRIELTMPINDAIACAPRIAQALAQSPDAAADSTPAGLQAPSQHDRDRPPNTPEGSEPAIT
ncbi:hypothetical protein ACIA5G_52215 [Amycolatopsis sp. NPDC051758]|uniref:hypothetical protein n=1 Tax=Amycolatopsis sp. NPDC051758 TaxID=3363935 RepID=UPI0037A4FF62